MRTVVAADLDPPAVLQPFSHLGQETQRDAPARGRSRLARWILALSLFGLLIGGGTWLVAWLLAPQHMTLARVHMEGEVRHTSRVVLQSVLEEQATGSFFAMDLVAIRRALEALPWIAHASVRRVWPLTLAVWVQEREALAYWGEHSLVSLDGEVFTPEAQTMPKGLARLQGPEGSAAMVSERYRWLRARLAAHGLKIAQLGLSARHAWYLELAGGLHLSLGTQDLEERIERFLEYLPRLPQPENLYQLDLRYANGFTARWRVPPVPPKVMAKRRRAKGGGKASDAQG
jgi:cell division protein FtsQ